MTMARSDRFVERKSRINKSSTRKPEMGYYLIVTDAEGTEPNYFSGLHAGLPNDIKNKIVIKVVETRTCNMIQKIYDMTAYDSQYRIPWIIFDRDRVKNFDSIISEAHNNNINVGWSNPCFEVWLSTYWGKMLAFHDSRICCSKFGELYKRKTGTEYSKSDADIYKRLSETGDEENAVKIAARRHRQHTVNGYCRPSDMIPCTTVYKLVAEIQDKVKLQNELNMEKRKE